MFSDAEFASWAALYERRVAPGCSGYPQGTPHTVHLRGMTPARCPNPVMNMLHNILPRKQLSPPENCIVWVISSVPEAHLGTVQSAELRNTVDSEAPPQHTGS